jgi:hypothetical protein
MNLKKQIDDLAESLLKEAMSGDERIEIRDKVDIFKATTAWHLGNVKVKKPEANDLDGVGTFEALKKRINGKAQVQ